MPDTARSPGNHFRPCNQRQLPAALPRLISEAASAMAVIVPDELRAALGAERAVPMTQQDQFARRCFAQVRLPTRHGRVGGGA